MLAGVEDRFGADRAPAPDRAPVRQPLLPHREGRAIVRHRSEDDGERDFAQDLGLVPCFTPVRSPESNGIAEAFVKTLKRDYVRVAPLPDAATALGLVAGWIHDDDTAHPRSALAMRSPREFRAALNPSRTVR